MAKKPTKKTIKAAATEKPRERGAKSQWIKDFLSQNPEAKLREVSEAAEAAGMGKVQHVQFTSAGGKATRRPRTAERNERVSGKIVEAAINFLTLAGGLAQAVTVLEQVNAVAKAIRKSKVPF